jgi:malonyl CoA-acyl carrier protein transacylase/phosphopantetheinyl transferase
MRLDSAVSTATAYSKSTQATRMHDVTKPLSSNYPRSFPAELFLVTARSREELPIVIHNLINGLRSHPSLRLQDVAYSLGHEFNPRLACLSIIADTLDDLLRKLKDAAQALTDPQCELLLLRDGVYYFTQRLGREGDLAFMFPGEGAQYANMLKDLCIHFPEMRTAFEDVDTACLLEGDGFRPSSYVFPPPGMSVEEVSNDDIYSWDKAVMAVLAANSGMMRLFRRLEVHPKATVGHSVGEFSALEMGGVLRAEDNAARIPFIRLAFQQIRELSQFKSIPEARLLNVGGAKRDQIEALIQRFSDKLTVAMDNCPHQYILCATGDNRDAIMGEAVGRLTGEGAICVPLNFHRPYHTVHFRSAMHVERSFYTKAGVHPPEVDVYSCCSADRFPDDADGIVDLATAHWSNCVRFRETIEAMHARGVRLFLEVGPRGNLCAFVDDILSGKPHLAIPADRQQRNAITQIHHALGLLAAHGVDLKIDPLHERRDSRSLDLKTWNIAKNDGKALTVPMGVSCPHMDASDYVKELGPLSAHRKAGMGTSTPTMTTQPPADTVSPSVLSPLPALPSPTPPAELSFQGRPERLRSEDSRAGTMQEYLRTMEHFLGMQQEIMAAFLEISTITGSRRQAMGQSRIPDCPGETHQFTMEPSSRMLSISWPSPIAQLPTSLKFHCCRVTDNGQGIWSLTQPDSILHQREQQAWFQLAGPERRRKEWLLGRMAAKDAVRLFLKDRCHLDLCPSDIEIVTDKHGRPSVAEDLMERLGCRISISIAHAGGVVAAVAGECGDHRGVGIDVEPMGRSHEGLEGAALAVEEQALLAPLPAASQEEWLLRLWCAKEAVGKALGRGMVAGPCNLVMQDLEVESGRVTVALMGELAKQLPELAGMSFAAHTGREGDLVFASSLV